MQKIYNIQNLDCAHCALKLERAINKLKCIESCSINFATSKMTINFLVDEKLVLQEIAQVIAKVEPEAEISSQEFTAKSRFNKKTFFTFLLFFVGIGFGVVTYVAQLPTIIYWLLLISASLLIGYKTYYKALTLLFKKTIDENFLVTISVVGAIALGEHSESLMVVGLYTLGKILESYAVNKTRKSVKSLMQLQPEFAIVIDGENEKKVSPTEVKIGSTIVVRPGERVPLDGIIIKGNANFNVKNLTGESIPKFIQENEGVLSGSIVIDEMVYIKTTGIYEDSAIARIMNLIEHASDKKSKTETFISKFARYYTLIVIGCSIVCFGLTWLILGNISTAIYRGLVFLVVACPCAFAISVPLSYFSGLGNASKYGILIKGSNYLDVMTKVDTIVFDKTGTLTTGIFGIDEIISLDKEYTKDDILKFACLGEQNSIHPIAKAIMHAGENIKLDKVTKAKEIAGKGVTFTYKNSVYFVGNSDAKKDSTSVDIVKDNKILGTILLSDKIKEDSFTTIDYIKNNKIKSVMLSGDNTKVTEKVANKLGIEEYHAEMLPEQKYKWLKDKIASENQKNKVAFVGDGINDAPSLSLADVGISMGLSGSPATVEASDIVIVDDNPQKIIKSIKISKFNRKIVLQNIIFAGVCKVTFLLLGALGITGMAAAVFADVGVTLLATLNSLRSLYHKL